MILKSLFVFIALSMFWYIGCNRYLTVHEYKCYHMEYYYPDNKKPVISKKNRHLVFAQSKEYLMQKRPTLYHENDTLWSYIFLNDSKEKLDSLWFKPNKIYLKKLNKQKVLCYKYNDFNEYSEVYIHNGIVIDMRFSLFKK